MRLNASAYVSFFGSVHVWMACEGKRRLPDGNAHAVGNVPRATKHCNSRALICAACSMQSSNNLAASTPSVVQCKRWGSYTLGLHSSVDCAIACVAGEAVVSNAVGAVVVTVAVTDVVVKVL